MVTIHDLAFPLASRNARPRKSGATIPRLSARTPRAPIASSSCRVSSPAKCSGCSTCRPSAFPCARTARPSGRRRRPRSMRAATCCSSGTLEPRKNVGGLLEGLRPAARARARRATSRDRRARCDAPASGCARPRWSEPPLAGHVEYRGYVPSRRPRSRCTRARRCSCCRRFDEGLRHTGARSDVRRCARDRRRTAAHCPKSSATRDCSSIPTTRKASPPRIERMIGRLQSASRLRASAASNARVSSPGRRRRATCGAPTKTPLLARRHRAPVLAGAGRAFTVEMRIGIDARELCGKPTGVGRHLSGLLGAWSADPAASRHTFVLYAHDDITPRRFRTRNCAGFRARPAPAWEQFALPEAANADRLDVFFAPGYTAPLLLNTPTVLLVHDISFAAHPEWFRWKEGLRRRWLTRWSCEHATTRADGIRRGSPRDHVALRPS